MNPTTLKWVRASVADMTNPTRELRHLRIENPSEGVAVLVLDNPEQRNAMSAEMTESWVSAIDAIAQDTSVRVVVVRGEGSAFTAGGDLDWLVSDPDADVSTLRARMLPFYRAWLSVRRLEVPTIAAVNGHAIGAGLCLALACDLRFARRGAAMGLPFTALGLHPGMGATFSLPDAVGAAAARDLLLTGRVVRDEEAVRLGLVSRVLEAEAFDDEVLAAARSVAATAPVAARLTTLALRGGGHGDLESALQWEALAQAVTLATDDVHEGIRAARERRAPDFKGR